METRWRCVLAVLRWLTLVLWALACFGCVPKKPVPANQPTPEPPPSVTPGSTPLPTLTPAASPTPSPLPETFIPSSRYEVAKLFNGFDVYSHVSTMQGQIAALEKKDPASYVLNLDVQVRVPKPAQTLDELQAPDPQLATILPSLPELLTHAKVSTYYHALYRLKVENLNRAIGRLDQMLARQNFFDCNTILELTGSQTGRKAL